MVQLWQWSAILVSRCHKVTFAVSTCHRWRIDMVLTGDPLTGLFENHIVLIIWVYLQKLQKGEWLFCRFSLAYLY